MALKDTVQQMEALLEHVQKDLGKAMKGNKAACQRVRTGTIKLEKTAKKFRKESVHAEKKGLLKKSSGKKAKAPKKAAKAGAAKRKIAKKSARRKAPKKIIRRVARKAAPKVRKAKKALRRR